MNNKEKQTRPVVIDETMKSSDLLQEVVSAMQSFNSLMVSENIGQEDSRILSILTPLVHIYDIISHSVSECPLDDDEYEDDTAETGKERVPRVFRKIVDGDVIIMKDSGYNVRKKYDELCDRYPAGTYCRNLQLAIPIDMHLRLEALKNEWFVPRMANLSKKDICIVALENFLEEHEI